MSDGADDSVRERNAKAEALRYLQEVRDELQRREQKLAVIQEELGRLRFRLEEVSMTRSLLEGNASKLAAGESFRAKLRGQIRKREAEVVEIRSEIVRARERRAMIESEIASLEEIRESVVSPERESAEDGATLVVESYSELEETESESDSEGLED